MKSVFSQCGRSNLPKCCAKALACLNNVYKKGTQARKCQAEETPYGRSLLSNCASYAKAFLSDVYKRGTRAKKCQAEGGQDGRSMVEMLGVLAIIGILSVGAIAGYSHAMFKYRMNKTIDVVTHFLQNLAELEQKKWGDDIYSKEDYVKYGLLPEEMCPADYKDKYTCKLPLGDIDMLFEQWDVRTLVGEFWINFYGGDKVESCITFLSHGWEKLYPQSWLMVRNGSCSTITILNGSDEQPLWSVIPEHNYISGGKQHINLTDIENACQICENSDYCQIEFTINNYI